MKRQASIRIGLTIVNISMDVNAIDVATSSGLCEAATCLSWLRSCAQITKDSQSLGRTIFVRLN
jgi:hypothetical protein